MGVVPLKSLHTKTEEKIREIARTNTKAIILTDHARERMEERGFDMTDLLHVLRNGDLQWHEPVDGKTGDIKCKMTKRIIGGRDAGVITVVKRATLLIIITMEWEDLS